VEIAAGGVNGGQYAGGIAGYVTGNSTIIDCYSTGNISATYAGGIAGQIGGSSITNCYSTVNISAVSYSGGIAGYMNSAKITNCYSTGNVSSSSSYNYSYCGGIAGLSDSGSTITNCYSTGSISAVYAGGIAGSLNYYNNYYNSLISCAAINPTIKANSYEGRIVSSIYGTNTVINNFALNSMISTAWHLIQQQHITA